MVNKSYIVEDLLDNNNIPANDIEKKCNSELYQKFGFLIDPEFYAKKRKNPKLHHKKGYSEIEISGERIGHKNKKIILTNKNDENKMIVENLNTKDIKEYEIEGEDVLVYPPHVVLFLSSTDKNAGLDKISYQMNGGSMMPYRSLIENFRKNELYKINVSVVDKLGNENQEEITFYIE